MIFAINHVFWLSLKSDNNIFLAFIAGGFLQFARIAHGHPPSLAAIRTFGWQRPIIGRQKFCLLVYDQERLRAFFASVFLGHMWLGW